MHVAIMAGGSGTRLWPRSRQKKPKQFQSLYSDNTLLQETVSRLEPLAERDDIYVIANRSHEESIRQQLDWLGEANFIGEPVGKDTAPAVGVVATAISQKDPDSVIMVTPADHVITKAEHFRDIVTAAAQVAASGPHVVTIGIKPNRPETGYGYIQMKESQQRVNGIAVHEVASFK